MNFTQLLSKKMGKCPICGNKQLWFNDLPIKAFCYGPESKPHKEGQKMVPAKWLKKSLNYISFLFLAGGFLSLFLISGIFCTFLIFSEIIFCNKDKSFNNIWRYLSLVK